MAVGLVYILTTTGAEFERAIALKRRGSQGDGAGALPEESYWEGRLPETSTLVGADLSGSVTVVFSDEKFSQFLVNDAARQRVLSWEGALRNLFPDTQIVRLSESVLDQWESRAGEYWFHDASKSHEFFGWISQQPTDSWSFI